MVGAGNSLAQRAAMRDIGAMTRDRPILLAFRSRRVKRRIECVLKRGSGIDRVLGDVLRDFPAVTIQEAIEELSAQGW